MNFYNNLKTYDENLNEIWKKEEEYKSLLVERYEESIDKLKADFRIYSDQNNYNVVEKNNFMEARYGDGYIVIRIDFNEVHPTNNYIVNLAIVETPKARREYNVIIRPMDENLYIPKRSITINRPRPKSNTEAKALIKSLGEEYLMLDEKMKRLKEISFKLNCHDAKFTPQEHEKFTPQEDEIFTLYEDFISILENLLNN